MTDAREIIQKAASKFEDLPHGRRYGLYDYSGYEGEAPPHVVLSPDGETVYRSNDRDAASAEYYRLSRLHRADFILAALTSARFRILGPDEIDGPTVEKCAEVASQRFTTETVTKTKSGEPYITGSAAIYAAGQIAAAIRALKEKRT